MQVLCTEWLRFEREHGTLEDYDAALAKVPTTKEKAVLLCAEGIPISQTRGMLMVPQKKEALWQLQKGFSRDTSGISGDVCCCCRASSPALVSQVSDRLAQLSALQAQAQAQAQVQQGQEPGSEGVAKEGDSKRKRQKARREAQAAQAALAAQAVEGGGAEGREAQGAKGGEAGAASAAKKRGRELETDTATPDQDGSAQAAKRGRGSGAPGEAQRSTTGKEGPSAAEEALPSARERAPGEAQPSGASAPAAGSVHGGSEGEARAGAEGAAEAGSGSGASGAGEGPQAPRFTDERTVFVSGLPLKVLYSKDSPVPEQYVANSSIPKLTCFTDDSTVFVSGFLGEIQCSTRFALQCTDAWTPVDCGLYDFLRETTVIPPDMEGSHFVGLMDCVCAILFFSLIFSPLVLQLKEDELRSLFGEASLTPRDVRLVFDRQTKRFRVRFAVSCQGCNLVHTGISPSSSFRTRKALQGVLSQSKEHALHWSSPFSSESWRRWC